MINKEKVINIVDEYLSGTEKFLVDITVSKNNNAFVFIDGDNEVTISDCAKLSRHIESFFDRENEDFELEVSSAGTEKAFMVSRQYKKNIGRDIKVTDLEGKKSKGKLIEVTEKGFRIDTADFLSKKEKKELQENTRKEFSFEEVKTVNIIFSFK